MRFGLIGYGLWGRHHAEAIVKAPGATLEAIACATRRRRMRRASASPACPSITPSELLDRRDIEAVDIVCPTTSPRRGCAALAADKNVLLKAERSLREEREVTL